jgi:ethanolamine ammonia-lyase small subunit
VNHSPAQLVTPTPWDALRQFTAARIALGRAGVSQPTAAHLAFQLAHAQARDAVHLPLAVPGVVASVQGLGCQTLTLHSQATDRATYLQRPDLGRRLDRASLETLALWRSATDATASQQGNLSTTQFDLALVVVDGLSALAIHQNAAPLLSELLPCLLADGVQAWSVAPVSVVEQGRVAIGDEVGDFLNARCVVVLIGERPGLSSPDSMGIYLTWAPKVGRLDAERNCISNVRTAGLSVQMAAKNLHQLLVRSRARQLSGVGLKDDADCQLATADVSSSPSQNQLPWSHRTHEP